MNKNLLIVGASTYGVVASEDCGDMGALKKQISLMTKGKQPPTGIEVVGTTPGY